MTRPTLAEIGESWPRGRYSRYRNCGRGAIGRRPVTPRSWSMLDGERLGEFIINRVNQGSQER